MTFLGILLAISGILQGWSRSNRNQGVKYAADEAPIRQVRQEEATEAEREAIRRDQARRKVRFR